MVCSVHWNGIDEIIVYDKISEWAYPALEL